MKKKSFPVEDIIPDLLDKISLTNVIISAPPGAGKSTVVPLALLKQVPEGKILLMQPRRVVVQNLANYLACQIGEPVGNTIGYRIRGESKVSTHTRLEVITEGILTRMIQSDPELTNVACIIFDEFHERSIHSDLGLALAIEVQQGLRDDLRLLVMSATLDSQQLAALMPDAAVLSSEGRMFPVNVEYTGSIEHQSISDTTAHIILQALNAHEGDVLAFLPGARWINQVQRILESAISYSGTIVCPLYGALPKTQQLAAIEPHPDGYRKIILATNIAETSLTIDGVTVVVDSGREWLARHHPLSGLNELSLQMISQASATQRMGRAGRTAPGVCYRLWAKSLHERLDQHTEPQIRREDASGLLLNALCWGTTVDSLPLIDQPSAGLLEASKALAETQGLVATSAVALTVKGKKVMAMSCQPRLATMLLKVEEAGATGSATNETKRAALVIAALAEENVSASSLNVSEAIGQLPKPVKDRIIRQANKFAKQLNWPVSVEHVDKLDAEALGIAIALAFPERIAFEKSLHQYKLTCGMGAVVRNASTSQGKWLAILEGQRQGNELTIFLAQPLEEKTLLSWFGNAVITKDVLNYNAQRGAMEARRVTAFEQIILRSEPIEMSQKLDPSSAWKTYLLAMPFANWPLGDAAKTLCARLALAAKLDLPVPNNYGDVSVWPQVSGQWIFAHTEIMKSLRRCKHVDELMRLPWERLLLDVLSWPQKDALNTLLPTSITVPAGGQRPLRYTDDSRVMLAVKMQEMFGHTAPIFIAKGRVKIVIDLLSPASRPIQTTDDLGRFWQGSYPDVCKEMKGKYPKHYWPEDPTTARPTTKVKRLMD